MVIIIGVAFVCLVAVFVHVRIQPLRRSSSKERNAQSAVNLKKGSQPKHKPKVYAPPPFIINKLKEQKKGGFGWPQNSGGWKQPAPPQGSKGKKPGKDKGKPTPGSSKDQLAPQGKGKKPEPGKQPLVPKKQLPGSDKHDPALKKGQPVPGRGLDGSVKDGLKPKNNEKIPKQIDPKEMEEDYEEWEMEKHGKKRKDADKPVKKNGAGGRVKAGVKGRKQDKMDALGEAEDAAKRKEDKNFNKAMGSMDRFDEGDPAEDGKVVVDQPGKADQRLKDKQNPVAGMPGQGKGGLVGDRADQVRRPGMKDRQGLGNQRGPQDGANRPVGQPGQPGQNGQVRQGQQNQWNAPNQGQQGQNQRNRQNQRQQGQQNQLNGFNQGQQGQQNQLNGQNRGQQGQQNQLNGQNRGQQGQQNQLNGQNRGQQGQQNQLNGQNQGQQGQQNQWNRQNQGQQNQLNGQNRGQQGPNQGQQGQQNPLNGQNRGQRGPNRGQQGTNRGQQGTNRGQQGTNRGQQGTNRGQQGTNQGQQGQQNQLNGQNRGQRGQQNQLNGPNQGQQGNLNSRPQSMGDPVRQKQEGGGLMGTKRRLTSTATSDAYVNTRTPVGTPPSLKRTKRQEAVVTAFQHAWKAYTKYAWGSDELNPVSRTGARSIFGMGLTIVDSLDTLWMMGLRDEYQKARAWVSESLDIAGNTNTVSVFETTIRVLGGLLSAFHLTGDKLYLEKAVSLCVISVL